VFSLWRHGYTPPWTGALGIGWYLPRWLFRHWNELAALKPQEPASVPIMTGALLITHSTVSSWAVLEREEDLNRDAHAARRDKGTGAADIAAVRALA
jgi:hypothetical protein